MKKWTVEMSYGVNICIEGVRANSYEEAVEKAREEFEQNRETYVDIDELGFEMATYVGQEE